MFFHVNWLHDRWYEAGFDEASGNAQQDNFGLGRPRRATRSWPKATTSAAPTTPTCRHAARRIEPPHADVPVRWPNPLPSRTSNHEALITFHEMGHYITNRLVGNGSGL